MDPQLYDSRSISHSSSGTATTSIPDDIQDALGKPDRVFWAVDRETGHVLVVPPEEVGVR